MQKVYKPLLTCHITGKFTVFTDWKEKVVLLTLNYKMTEQLVLSKEVLLWGNFSNSEGEMKVEN